MGRFLEIRWFGALMASLLLLGGVLAFAVAKESDSSDEKAIQDSAQAFTGAFNGGNAKEVAALWTEDGKLIGESGEVFKGRPAIEEAYAAFFKRNPKARISVTIESIDFPAPGFAIEDGLTTCAVEPSATPTGCFYSVVHVFKDGKWRIASASEMHAEAPPEVSRLGDLGWLIGKWQTKTDDTTVRANFHWVVDGKFIQRDYSIEKNGKVTTSGFHLIGWDPQRGQIRSWHFDATGAHGMGFWTAIPEGWSIHSEGTLADGTPISSNDIIVCVPGQKNVVGWKSINRMAGPVHLPDVREIVLDRVPEK